jgi:uncharacterized glyoxalase superfamily protein PhnB
MSSPNAFAHGPANRSMPASTVIPVLHYPDVAAAAAQLCRCFGFGERLRIGEHRVQLDVGTGAVVVAQARDATPAPPATTHSVMVRVTDVDAHFAHARSAGATLLSEPVSFPYGERQYSAVDTGGHVWTFSQSVEDADPARWGGELVHDTRVVLATPHARIGTFDAPASRLDELVALFQDRVVQALDASGETARRARSDAAALGAVTVGEPQLMELAFDTRRAGCKV